MPDWYVSSAAWTAIAQFATGSYSVGQIVRPLTAPAFNAQYAFRCTTAGSASAEPTWTSAASNNQTVTATGGAVFTNVSGQSTYGWSAAAGTVASLTNNTRFTVGDRAFLSSDHSETNTSGGYSFTGGAFGLIQIISVNRAGSVPPVAADQLSGATITMNSGSAVLDAQSDLYWQGITFATNNVLFFNNSGSKAHYLRNCALQLTGGGANRIGTANIAKVTLDNTTVSFSGTGQAIGNGQLEFVWLNTPSALLGTVPTTLFQPNIWSATCRGVDLSTLTTAILNNSNSVAQKILLDSCRIASGVSRFTMPGAPFVADEVELVNCYDGTNVLSERHTAAGDLTTNRSTTMVGGAQDDSGLFSHQMVSSARADGFTYTFDSFWLDIENTLVGASHTATVEIVSSASLNNTDISLQLEYLGTSGSSLASFVSTLPSALTASAAVGTSTATWNNAPAMTWNPSDMTAGLTLSNGSLTATVNTQATNAARSNGNVSSGKFYIEFTWGSTITGAEGVGIATSAAVLNSTTYTGSAFITQSGGVYVNNASLGVYTPSFSPGNICCVAVDLTNNMIWFRNGAAGNWNNNVANNPTTNTGGLAISTILPGPVFGFVAFNAATVGAAITANFGGSAFTGAVPSGFTVGVPSGPQHLQATFTPQQAGRLRGIVRLGKPSTTCWINPQITVT